MSAPDPLHRGLACIVRAYTSIVLFLLFINDMPDDIMSSIKIFADDTKVYKDVQTEEDMLTLQKDVYALCDWSL